MPLIPAPPSESRIAAYHQAMAYMVHPTDMVRRDELLAFAKVNTCMSDGAAVNIEGEELAAVMRAMHRGVGKDIERAKVGGQMAGLVLLYVFQLRASGVSDAGLDKARHMVSEAYSQEKRADGKGFPASRETIERHWEAYRSAAHLWAARGVWTRILERGFEPGAEIDPAALDELLATYCKGWISLAEAFRLEAIETVLPRSDKLLLNPSDAWEANWFDSSPIERIPVLPSDELAWLDTFTPRIRHK